MKFKLDENLSPELSPLFSQSGHEAHTVLEEGLSGVLRPVRTANMHIRALVLASLPSFNEEALHGRLWIVEPGRIRVHKPAGEEG